jgi:hypothetical protein
MSYYTATPLAIVHLRGLPVLNRLGRIFKRVFLIVLFSYIHIIHTSLFVDRGFPVAYDTRPHINSQLVNALLKLQLTNKPSTNAGSLFSQSCQVPLPQQVGRVPRTFAWLGNSIPTLPRCIPLVGARLQDHAQA